jgi:hypothetical protein
MLVHRLQITIINNAINGKNSLDLEQHSFYNSYVRQFQQFLAEKSPEPLYMNINGSTGCGKSYVLTVFCSRFYRMANKNGLPDPVLRSAPTSVAALKIHGRILHSLLQPPIQKNTTFDAFAGSPLMKFQYTFANVRSGPRSIPSRLTSLKLI